MSGVWGSVLHANPVVLNCMACIAPLHGAVMRLVVGMFQLLSQQYWLQAGGMAILAEGLLSGASGSGVVSCVTVVVFV
jgi:hypothetical protein